MRKVLLLFLLSILTYSPFAQKVFKVPSEYPNIQAAINAAWDGDTVLIADGKYTGEGNRDIRYYGKEIIVTSENGPDSCIISYGYANEWGYAQSSSAFIFHGGETIKSILNGITIINQTGGYDSTDRFEGIAIGAKPLISNCIFRNTRVICNGEATFYKCRFEDNYSHIRSHNGAAIYSSYNSNNKYFRVIKCSFINNRAPNGGAICSLFGYIPDIDSCTFIGNQAWNDIYEGGGAINVQLRENTPCIITNSQFINNSSEDNYSKAGAIYHEGYKMLIDNCIFVGNTSPIATVYSTERNCILNKCTFYNNICDASVGALRGGTATNCIFWRNLPQETSNSVVSYSLIRKGHEGEGNIDADPLFVNPDSLDFSLQPNSPCIDTGNPNSELDPDGTRADMGAIPFNQLGIERIVAKFSANPISGKFPLNVQFADNSTVNNTTITSWLWDFGDGDNSTEQSPQHTYHDIGKYPVQLIVTNGDLADTLLKEDYINVKDTTSATIPTEGLVAYYPFNGNANDESGNGHHGSPASHSDFSGIDRFGNLNSAFYSGNSSSYITIPHSSQLDLQSHSISAWIKVAGHLAGGGIFGNGYNIDHYALVVDDNNVNTWINYPKSTNDFQNLATSNLKDEEYHHIVSSYDLSSRKIWIDGILEDEMAFSESIDYSTKEDCYIGMNFPGGNEWFYGYIDEIRIYNRALSVEEIESIYNYQTDKATSVRLPKFNDNKTVNIYPNPTNNKIFIESPYDEVNCILIYTIDGKCIFQSKKTSKNKIEMNLETYGLSEGIYLISVKTQSDYITHKLILQ